MSNSGLVSYTQISPNKNSPRNNKIDRITIHVYVGQVSVERMGRGWAKAGNTSANYGIGTDGRIGLYVEERDRSWCSSNRENDHRAITIECASDTKEPYAINSNVYKSLIDLCVDICKRNGKNKVLWFADKNKTLNYKPADNEMIFTVHRWFANKSCPGNYVYSRLGQIADEINKRIASKEEITDRTYTVRANDTLWFIAKNMLGSGARYMEIKKLNGLTTNVIQVGQVLKLPIN